MNKFKRKKVSLRFDARIGSNHEIINPQYLYVEKLLRRKGSQYYSQEEEEEEEERFSNYP